MSINQNSTTINKYLIKIANEREKQLNKKGYTHEHDDKHVDGSIADAAAHYASHSETNLYPWNINSDTKNNHTRKEQLIIASALILAELERLDRSEGNQ